MLQRGQRITVQLACVISTNPLRSSSESAKSDTICYAGLSADRCRAVHACKLSGSYQLPAIHALQQQNLCSVSKSKILLPARVLAPSDAQPPLLYALSQHLVIVIVVCSLLPAAVIRSLRSLLFGPSSLGAIDGSVEAHYSKRLAKILHGLLTCHG